MATSTPVHKARTALIALLVVLFGMGGLLAYGVHEGRAQWAPLLALDLEGGTQMVLAPQIDTGEEIDSEQLQQAVEIIRQRVDGTGVSEAEIAVQGAENIVVSLPGVPDQETRELIQASADMEFRSVLQTGQDPDFAFDVIRQNLEDEGADDDEIAEFEEQLEAQRQEQEDQPDAQPEDFPEPTSEPENNSDPNWITQELAADFANYSCAREISLEERSASDPDEPLISCNPETGETFLLGPVDVPGVYIDDASFGMEQTPQGTSTGRWVVDIEFDSDGTESFRQSSTRLYGLQGDQNRFAVVLDGHAIVAPSMNSPILDGRAQITGNFTEQEARNLSEQLRYGSLPIAFSIESEQQISATLGQDQLRMGLLAGVIGLILTAGYALFHYRALGLVTITSLIVAGIITWWAIALLGWSDGYRLSLAGIAGLILSIGLTVDSFVVYFERIKDELREGRSLAGAVEAGWARARRTILASKAVNLIAAVVLYLVAVGNVRGFAFTLGLTALIDVILVFLFTHPLMQLLARRKFFAAGRTFSGLSAKELGVDVLYRGAGRFARRNVVYSDPEAVGAMPSDKPLEEGGPVNNIDESEWAAMTIAERRKAQQAQTRQVQENQDEPLIDSSVAPSNSSSSEGETR